MSNNTVFISYSHEDKVWKERLLPQLKALAQAGVDMTIWEDGEAGNVAHSRAC